jgi:hypothetical protein
VRTAGLTDAWEIELPHIPFSFEFDSRLVPESLFALADHARGEQIARAVRLEAVSPDDAPSRFLDLNGLMALRDPPRLAVATPLPCDLAHSVAIEIEGIPGRHPSTELILSGQGEAREGPSTVAFVSLGPILPLPEDAIVRPGVRRLRAVLTAVPDHGWADPDVRSIWPGTIETDWVEVEVVRK